MKNGFLLFFHSLSLFLSLSHVLFFCAFFTQYQIPFRARSSYPSSFCNFHIGFLHLSLQQRERKLALYKSSDPLVFALSMACVFLVLIVPRKLPSPTILLSSHLELVAACHPIIADHPDNVSVSQSSQMIMTPPGCCATWDSLGFSILRSGVCMCAHACQFQCMCEYVCTNSLCAGRKLGRKAIHYLLVLIFDVCKCVHVCTEFTELKICVPLSVHA